MALFELWSCNIHDIRKVTISNRFYSNLICKLGVVNRLTNFLTGKMGMKMSKSLLNLNYKIIILSLTFYL